MFSRPRLVQTAPPPYSPGYLAFPPAAHTGAVSKEARFSSERVASHGENVKSEPEEREHDRTAREAAEAAWAKAEEARRANRAKLKEEILKAELEWVRMGGELRDTDGADAELRRQLDTDAKLSDEERTLLRSWEEYDKAWDRLTVSIRPVKTFTFRKLRPEEITGPAIAGFLLHPLRDPKKSRREKLREAILRYHPDKFEGRILPRVVAEDRARVKEAVGIVIKCLNELMSVET